MHSRSASGLRSFVRIVRAFAEASVIAFGFAFAILAIGTPTMLIIHGLRGGLSWVAGLVGGPSALVDALVLVASVGGGVILTAVFVRLLVRFFTWRRRFRADEITWQAATARVDQRGIGAGGVMDACLADPTDLFDDVEVFYNRRRRDSRPARSAQPVSRAAS